MLSLTEKQRTNINEIYEKTNFSPLFWTFKDTLSRLRNECELNNKDSFILAIDIFIDCIEKTFNVDPIEVIDPLIEHLESQFDEFELFCNEIDQVLQSA